MIDIQNRGQLAADLGQQRQLPRLTRDARVQACVFDTDCDAGCEQCEQALMFFAKRPRLTGFHIDDADNFVLGDQRRCQLRTRARRGVDEVLLRRNIVDQHGLAPQHCLPGDPLAHLDADALGNLGRMADLKSYAQLLGFLVQQQDGKDFIVDNLLQHLGHALQQSVQVERGVDRVGDLKQVRIERRMNRRLCDGR
jgi:hypothetical protein